MLSVLPTGYWNISNNPFLPKLDFHLQTSLHFTQQLRCYIKHHTSWQMAVVPHHWPTQAEIISIDLCLLFTAVTLTTSISLNSAMWILYSPWFPCHINRDTFLWEFFQSITVIKACFFYPLQIKISYTKTDFSLVHFVTVSYSVLKNVIFM
jgi:hypothetical protein